MNWTTFDPIEGQKYIVETNNGSVFPAHVINGNSWWSDKGFPIEGVTRWIPYPTGGGVKMMTSQLKYCSNMSAGISRI